MIYLGIDTGGTFTDFIFLDDGVLTVHKVLSTPESPEEAIFKGLMELGLRSQSNALTIIHGSTVATNAVLEGKGVKTAYITNKGFADVLSIGRQARHDLYSLQPDSVSLPLDRQHCLEVDYRVDGQGQCLVPLTRKKIEKIVDQVKLLAVDAIAVNFLFSYQSSTAEQQLSEAFPRSIFVSLSSEILSEIGEYERGMATWLNAWVGPLIQGYMERLSAGLDQCRLSVMQSCGETMLAQRAAKQAVQMLLSGPAGGLVGAQFLSQLSGRHQLMTIDMGGTSTDVALLDGEIHLTNRGRIGVYPVAVPMVDMHTIGAGGGSIARLDEGGMLLVGPESAGAKPGPACYGLGGTEATVTDANMVLGRIPDNTLLGGYLPLNKQLAVEALQGLAEKMAISVHEVALGIVEIANEHMARALKVISIQKGFDPSAFTLVSFGGAGGMHVCALADELGMTEALVPIHAGVLSALGMLVAKPGKQLSHTMIALLTEVSVSQLAGEFNRLESKGKETLQAEGIQLSDIASSFSLDLRYQGQSNTLNIPWDSLDSCQDAFHQQHERRYGHRLKIPVEMVNIRVMVTAKQRSFEMKNYFQHNPRSVSEDQFQTDNVIHRKDLLPGLEIKGPVTLVEPIATVWIAKHWTGQIDSVGNLLLHRKSG